MKVVLCSLLSLFLLAASVLGQVKPERNRNPLIGGRLMYVGPMPQKVDAWIVHDLRAWGKYKPTRDIEGVDLVMKAYQPETIIQYEMRRGIPLPKGMKKKRDHKYLMFSIIVTDWVTGRQVWQAEVLDRKPKGTADLPPAKDAEIRARGLSIQQLARAITRDLQRYVDHLASESAVH